MRLNSGVAIAVFAFAPAAAIAAADEPKPISAVEFTEMNRLDDPSISPDGTVLAFVRSETDWDKNQVVKKLYLKADGDQTVSPVTLGSGTPVLELKSGAVWEPGGNGFLVLLDGGKNTKEQAFYYYSGTSTLAQLTSHNEDVENPQWSPDGSAVYFTASQRVEQKIRLLRSRDYLIRDYETRAPKEVRRFDRSAGESEPVITGDFFVRNYALSRDGSQIIYMRADGGLIDDRQAGELWLHDLAASQSKQLTRNNYAEQSARLSPDNTSFAFIATVNEAGEPYYEDNLFVQKIGDVRPRLLMPDIALEVLDFAWDKAGQGLFLLGNSGLRTQLYHYNLDSEQLRRLTSGDHVIDNWTYDPVGDRHVAMVTSAANPGEVHRIDVTDTSGGTLIQLTGEYADWPARFAVPKQEAVSWTGRDGQPLEGLLVYPNDHAEGQPVPLVTITHGGPRSSSQFGAWNASRSVSVLAGQGYGVFLPNHRGGTGYGDAFMRDMVGGYFVNAHLDVLDGIDALIERGFADPDQLIKMGWSAGGHMTNKLVTITDRFKAASSGAGASDWLSMYGESDNRFNRTPWFGGSPWEEGAPIAKYREQSVVQDAWRASTPTVIYVGENDERVPPTQSILMYRALKAAGVETELFIADGEPHNFRKPSHKLFKVNNDLQWFARHLGREPFEPQWPPAALAPKKQASDEAEKDEPEQELPVPTDLEAIQLSVH